MPEIALIKKRFEEEEGEEEEEEAPGVNEYVYQDELFLSE
jgi:hypothetical protein